METYEWAGKVYHEVGARLLWSLGHYDGPMSGIAMHDGKVYYAKCHQSPHTKKKPRYFWLYPLSDEEVRREHLYQEMFRHYYGIYCDYEEDGRTRKSKASGPCWSPGPLDFTGLRCLDFILRLLLGPFVETKDPWKPSYEEMRKAAGVNHDDFGEREATGYFVPFRR
jgi:hypothetical protein